MKCVLVFIALLAAWMTSSEAAKTCEESASCTSDMAKIDQSNMNELCDATRGVLTCFTEVMADCRAKKHNITEQTSTRMDALKRLINTHCGSGTASVSLGLLLVAFLVSLF